MYRVLPDNRADRIQDPTCIMIMFTCKQHSYPTHCKNHAVYVQEKHKLKPVFQKDKWKAKLTAYKGNIQWHSSQSTRAIMPKLTSYNGNNDRIDIIQEVTDGQVVRALVSVAWKCTVMIWRSWVWTPAGANLGFVVLLSQVVLQPKIIMTKLTAHMDNNEKADSIQGQQWKSWQHGR